VNKPSNSGILKSQCRCWAENQRPARMRSRINLAICDIVQPIIVAISALSGAIIWRRHDLPYLIVRVAGSSEPVFIFSNTPRLERSIALPLFSAIRQLGHSIHSTAISAPNSLGANRNWLDARAFSFESLTVLHAHPQSRLDPPGLTKWQHPPTRPKFRY
jgi:hypothetical protein